MKWRVAFSVALLAVLGLTSVPDAPAFRWCGFHWLTSLDCPLCGLTRGLFALGKGHWAEALRWNALSPLGFMMLFSLIWNHPLRPQLWTAGIAAFGAYGLWRIL